MSDIKIINISPSDINNSDPTNKTDDIIVNYPSIGNIIDDIGTEGLLNEEDPKNRKNANTNISKISNDLINAQDSSKEESVWDKIDDIISSNHNYKEHVKTIPVAKTSINKISKQDVYDKGTNSIISNDSSEYNNEVKNKLIHDITISKQDINRISDDLDTKNITASIKSEDINRHIKPIIKDTDIDTVKNYINDITDDDRLANRKLEPDSTIERVTKKNIESADSGNTHDIGVTHNINKPDINEPTPEIVTNKVREIAGDSSIKNTTINDNSGSTFKGNIVIPNGDNHIIDMIPKGEGINNKGPLSIQNKPLDPNSKVSSIDNTINKDNGIIQPDTISDSINNTISQLSGTSSISVQDMNKPLSDDSTITNITSTDDNNPNTLPKPIISGEGLSKSSSSELPSDSITNNKRPISKDSKVNIVIPANGDNVVPPGSDTVIKTNNAKIIESDNTNSNISDDDWIGKINKVTPSKGDSSTDNKSNIVKPVSSKVSGKPASGKTFDGNGSMGELLENDDYDVKFKYNGTIQKSQTKNVKPTDPRTKFTEPDYSKIMDIDSLYPIIRANGLFADHDIKWFSEFSRFNIIEPYKVFMNTREYVFFTRPDLHLLTVGDKTKLNDELKAYPYFQMMNDKHSNILQMLQTSAVTLTSPFIPILTMAAKNTLDLPSIQSAVNESSANVYGIEISYASTSEESDYNHEFTMEFEETKQSYIYNIFKVWDEYERLKFLGKVSPPDITYIWNKILHDQVSVYKFIVDNDGETILFFAKMWGVYPKSVPRDAFSSMEAEGGLDLPVSFHAEFTADSDPAILQDFNIITSPYTSGRKDVPIWDSSIGHVNRDWVLCPYVNFSGDKPKLKWR